MQLAQLVEAAVAGEDIVIEKNGVPAIRLVPVEPSPKRLRRPGLLKGKFDIPDDFDAPLPDDVLADFEGR